MSDTDSDSVSGRIATDELLADLRRVADELGHSPTVGDYRDHGKYSPKSLQKRFGSWNAAKEVAGLDTTHSTSHISDLELLADLHRVETELGHVPSTRDYAQRGEHSYMTLCYRFGSWRMAKWAVAEVFDE